MGGWGGVGWVKATVLSPTATSQLRNVSRGLQQTTTVILQTASRHEGSGDVRGTESPPLRRREAGQVPTTVPIVSPAVLGPPGTSSSASFHLGEATEGN